MEDIANQRERKNGTRCYAAPDGGKYKITPGKVGLFTVRRYCPRHVEHPDTYGMPVLLGRDKNLYDSLKLVERSIERVKRRMEKAEATA